MSNTYTKLSDAYNGFLNPTCEIEIDGAKLPATVQLDNITVSLGMGNAVNACHFNVSGLYERGSRSFSANVVNKLQPGGKLRLSLGYGSSTEDVFYGYIDELGFHFRESGISIQVNCLDARALMRKGRTLKISNDAKTTMETVVKDILQKYSALVSPGNISLAKLESDVNLVTKGNDLSFIVKAAMDRGLQFYIENDKAIIAKKSDTVCVEFVWEQCEMDFGVRYLNQKYVAKGYDHSAAKGFTAESTVKAKTSQKNLMTVERAVMLPPSTLGKAGETILKAMAETDERGVFRGTLRCRGIPQPRLCQKVKIRDFPLISVSKTDTFTVISVKHSLSQNSGYDTELGIEG